MSLEDLARVVISTEGPALTQVGFGTLLCAAYLPAFGDGSLTHSYTSLTDLAADSIDVAHPAYLMVQRAFQQAPRPATVKLGRLTLPATQTVKFTPTAAINLTVYGFTMAMKTSAGVQTAADITYTSDSLATVAEIVAGLAAAVEASTLGALVAGTASDTNTRTQIVTGAAGAIVYYSDWTSNLTFEDVTADPGIATDLAAIRLADSDFYGLAVDQNAKAIVVAAAGWAETQDMLFGWNTSDSGTMATIVAATDVGAVLEGLAYTRSIGVFSKLNTGSYAGVACLAERFPHDPGQVGAGGTFHGKTLRGVAADSLTSTQKTNVRARNVEPYITTAGRNHTLDGKTASGEFADKTRGLDWFRIRTEENIAAALLNADKVPYDDDGIGIVKAELDSMGQIAEQVKLFIKGSFTSSAPKASDVSSADRAARKLTGLMWSAQLAGAIHLVDPVSGVVTN